VEVRSAICTAARLKWGDDASLLIDRCVLVHQQFGTTAWECRNFRHDE
jgi:hypothetical protein